MKKFSRTFSLFIIGCLTLQAQAKTEEIFVDDQYFYNIDTETGEAEFIQQKRWYNDPISEVKEVIIPETITYKGITYRVTSMAYNALCGVNNITKVVVPNSVKTMGDRTFAECNNLTEVILPSNLKILPNSIFCDCPSLKVIDLPKDITVIPESAFNGCKSLSSIVIPGKVKKIESMAFSYCESLRYIYLPPSVKEIDCGLSEISYPRRANIYITDLDAFCRIKCSNWGLCGNSSWNLYLNDTEVTDLIVPEGVDNIRWFRGCDSFVSITTPKSLKNCDINFDAERVILSSGTEKATIYSENLKYVAVYAAVPPELTTSTYYVQEAELHVLKGKKELYQSNENWAKFKVIIDDLEAEDAGVDDITADTSDTVTVYNLNGIKVSDSVSGLTPGIYIVRQGNATRKVVIGDK